MDRSAPLIFDRPLWDRRRLRAAQGNAAELFLMERAAEDLGERLDLTKRTFDTALEIGNFNSPLADLLPTGQVHRWFRFDSIGGLSTGANLLADFERLPIADNSLDLCLSCLSLHMANDLPGALVQIRSALKPDGLFLAALIGGETLSELRQAFAEAEIETLGGMSPRVAPMADVRSLGSLLQRAGFALPVVDVDTVKVTYESPIRLLMDLRAMGATNVLHDRHKAPLLRQTLMRAMAIYQEKFSNDAGKVVARFDIAHLSGWAPHPAQPKPLAPGSASTRLADALHPGGKVDQTNSE